MHRGSLRDRAYLLRLVSHTDASLSFESCHYEPLDYVEKLSSFCVPAFISSQRSSVRFTEEQLKGVFSDEKQSQLQALEEAYEDLLFFRNGPYALHAAAAGLSISASVVPGWMIIFKNAHAVLKVPPPSSAVAWAVVGAAAAFIAPFALTVILSDRVNELYLTQLQDYRMRSAALPPMLQEDFAQGAYHDLFALSHHGHALVNAGAFQAPRQVTDLSHLIQDLGRYLGSVVKMPRSAKIEQYCLPEHVLRSNGPPKPRCFPL